MRGREGWEGEGRGGEGRGEIGDESRRRSADPELVEVGEMWERCGYVIV